MTMVSQEPSRVVEERRRWSSEFLVRDMWASLAIAVIWLSVLFDAIYGPDIVNRSVAGDFSTIPSAVVVALFAFLATWVVAKYGYPRERKE
jgi:multisubunit Na+/H+ antiporter MnhF subunit